MLLTAGRVPGLGKLDEKGTMSVVPCWNMAFFVIANAGVDDDALVCEFQNQGVYASQSVAVSSDKGG